MSTDEVSEYNGIRLDLSHEAVGEEIRTAVNEGWYEAHEARLVEDYLPSSTDVIELGAGLGYISCVIDRAIDDGRTQIAVEPNPAVIPVLERTKQLNDATYTICERAYSSTADSVELTQSGEFWTATTHATRGTTVRVPTTSLEAICDRHSLSTFALVLDIEGAEYDLLTSELALLEERCSLLIVEYHDSGPYASEYDAELDRSAFELIDGIEAVCAYRNTTF